MKNLFLTAITFFGLVSITMAQVPNYVPISGLVGWWPFTGNANDLSVNVNNGTNNGATLTLDRFGNINSAYNFNGTTNYINVLHNSSFNFSVGQSISFWIYRSAGNGGGGNMIISKGATVSYGFNVWSNFNSNDIVYHYINGNYFTANQCYLPVLNYYNMSEWTHFVITNNLTAIKIYKNGMFIYQNSVAFPTTTLLGSNLGNMFFGKGVGHFAGESGFTGKIDDIGIWNRALTACEITQLYNASVYTTPTITATSSTTLCSGNTTTLTTSTIGSYTWSTGANTQSIAASTAGTYSVSVTNGACIGNASPIVISVNPTPTITVNSGVICSGQSFTMLPIGAITYTYSSGSNVVSPLVNTSYSVTGTNALGCVSSNTAISAVTVNASPVIAVNSGSICSGRSFTMVPSGATSYTYSSGTNIVSPLATSNYSVTGTNALGCVGSNTAISNVIVNASPVIAVNSGSICSGKSFTMIPSGATSYTYSSGSNIVSPLTTTSYSVRGTSALGCVGSNTAISSVVVNATPSVVALASNTLICLGQSVVLTASSTATSYTWNTGATTLTLSVSPTVTSTFTVSVSNISGCAASSSVMVNVNTCTSMEEDVFNATTLYPNPNHGLFTIELNETTQVMITDVFGQVILTETVMAGKQTLDIKNHANGIYFVKLIKDGKQQTIKLIKE